MSITLWVSRREGKGSFPTNCQPEVPHSHCYRWMWTIYPYCRPNTARYNARSLCPHCGEPNQPVYNIHSSASDFFKIANFGDPVDVALLPLYWAFFLSVYECRIFWVATPVPWADGRSLVFVDKAQSLYKDRYTFTAWTVVVARYFLGLQEAMKKSLDICVFLGKIKGVLPGVVERNRLVPALTADCPWKKLSSEEVTYSWILSRFVVVPPLFRLKSIYYYYLLEGVLRKVSSHLLVLRWFGSVEIYAEQLQ